MISIVIAHYKTPALLRLCIKSILKLKEKDKGLIEKIIVSDGETNDEVYDLIEEDFGGENIKLVAHDRNVGYSHLVNSGIREARGEYIFIINADIVILPETLKKMKEWMLQNSEVGILGPQLLNFNSTFQHTCFSFYTPLTILCRRTFFRYLPFGRRIINKFLMRDRNLNEIQAADWIMGSALFVRKSAIDHVGLMDENFFMYFEDVDWCRRFWENGYKVIYYPYARMYHYHIRASKRWGGALDVLNPKTWMHIKSAFYYFKKYKFRVMVRGQFPNHDTRSDS